MQLKTVSNAVRVLDCFDHAHPVWGVTELANQLSYDKGSLHHLVSTLEQCGLLERLDNGKYALGIRLFELGMVALGRLSVAEIARPELLALKNQFEETAHLAVLSEYQAVFVEKLESSRHIRMSSLIGSRTPLHCSAVGKVLLAGHLELLPRIVPMLTAFTSSTITSAGRLMEELQAVSQQGYAVNQEETEMELVGVAAPIYDHSGSVCAAISLAGPPGRMLQIGIPALAEALRASGERISRALGYHDGATHLGRAPMES